MTYTKRLSTYLKDELPHGTTGEHCTLQREGCDLRYWLCGPDDGSRVVLTHANLTDHRMFNLQVPVLAQRHRLLLWDVRGHGASRPTHLPFTASRVVADLVALMDDLDWNTAIFIGHSMGGNIAQDVAFYHPERVRALFALDCSCNTLSLSALERLALRLAPSLLRLYPFGALKRQSAQVSSDKPEIRKYLRDVFDQLSRSEFVALSSEMASFLHAEPDYRLPLPLLIGVGEHDATGNIRAAAPIWAERDGAKLEIIPNAGHCANLDNPEAVNALLLDFLASQTR